MNLDEVRDRIATDDEGKWDNLLDAEEMCFQNGRLTFPRLYRADHPKGLALTKWATAQVCQRLNVPLAYFRRCPPALQDVQMNHWLHLPQAERANGNGTKPETNGRHGKNGHPASDRWFLRAKGDVLRGALSERYTRLDNADLLTALLPSLESRYEVAWFGLSDESLHLRLVDPRLARDVLPGDRLVAGLHIANSEVGKRSVTVDALVFRMVCANGLVRLVKGRSLLHQRHIAVNAASLELALKNAIRDALMQGAGFMERMSWATEQHVPDVPGTLDTIAEDWNLSQALVGKVQDAIRAEPRHQHETLYGLVNGLTSAAQSLEADDRYTLETLAGRLLETGPPRPKARETVSVATPATKIAPAPLTTPRSLSPGAAAEERNGELSLFAGDTLLPLIERPIK